ncbi:MAG: DUF1080 domain-containing protein [Balneolaceae bacterium]
MKYLVFIFPFFLLVDSIYAQEYKQLFNGENLSGWTIHGTEKWYVDEGELVCESGPDKNFGYLSTNESYKNFVLSLYFKQEANGNSGVFFRSSIEGTKISGWQVEVAPEGLHTGGVYESYGRGWLIKPDPEDEKILKPTDWNHLVIRVVNEKVTTWLNENQMIHLKDEKIGQEDGFIALQIHSVNEGSPENVKVRWKDIRIKVLE